MSIVKRHMVKETVCKDCWYIFYPQYRWHFMTCFCSEPVSVDWTPEYTRIIWNHPEKVVETGDEFPCCISMELTDWQQKLKQIMLLKEEPKMPTVKDYSLYYKKNVEWKNV